MQGYIHMPRIERLEREEEELEDAEPSQQQPIEQPLTIPTLHISTSKTSPDMTSQSIDLSCSSHNPKDLLYLMKELIKLSEKVK